jgi:N-acetylmuramoyl-L-alanine amidase
MRPLNEIIIHCSATRQDWMRDAKTSEKVAEIRRWHVKDRGWRDIGYHYLIDRDGTVAKGRPLEHVGAHVAGRNTGTIGVCLIGGHGSAETDTFAKHYTVSQERSLKKVIADLKATYPSIKAVTGHNQFAAKACPGFNVPKWYAVSGTATKQPQVTIGRHVNETAKSEHDARDVLTPRLSLWAELAKLIATIFRSRK